MSDFMLGEHEARLDRIEKDIGEIKVGVNSLLLSETKRKAAWRTAVGAGAFFGAIASFFANVVKVAMFDK